MILSQLADKKVVQQQAAVVTEFVPAYDVIVVGLGTAGAVAAIQAAREGLRVLGLEKWNGAGGTGTIGGVLGYYFGSRGGMFEEIDREVFALQRMERYTHTGGISGELKKYVMEQKMIEAGVTVQYEATVTGVYLEAAEEGMEVGGGSEKPLKAGGKVIGVRWHGPNGEQSAFAKIVIDCTGDACVCAMAGAAFRLGRAFDGLPQPYSNVLELANEKGTSRYYTDSGFVDPTDGEAVSAAVIDSAIMPTHLKDFYDEDSRIMNLAPLLGVREGRLIIGEENVTFADYLQDRVTDQPIFYAYSNLDVHNKDLAFESELHQDWVIAASLWGVNFSVPIPLGALIPKGFDGLLAAGRALAVDHDMAACVRMKRDMQKSGEAAAIAASLSIRKQVPLTEVPYEELAARLRATGCLDEKNNVSIQVPAANAAPDAGQSWLTDAAQIREMLDSEKPGIAIWSTRRLGESIRDHLREWVKETDRQHLSRHSAIALALQHDRAAVPLLREMVYTRDSFVPKTGRKYNQVRGYAAIYLLGKLKDREIVPELLNIMRDRPSFKNLSTDAEFIGTDDEYFFQYFTFSLTALFRIGDHHADLREKIVREVSGILQDPELKLVFSLKPTKDLMFSMNDHIRKITAKKFETWEVVSVEQS